MHVRKCRSGLLDDSVQKRLGQRIDRRSGNGQLEVKAGEKLHDEIGLRPVFDKLDYPMRFGCRRSMPEFGFMHEGLVLVAIFGRRGQQLLEGEPALSPLLKDLHHDGGGPGWIVRM